MTAHDVIDEICTSITCDSIACSRTPTHVVRLMCAMCGHSPVVLNCLRHSRQESFTLYTGGETTMTVTCRSCGHESEVGAFGRGTENHYGEGCSMTSNLRHFTDQPGVCDARDCEVAATTVLERSCKACRTYNRYRYCEKCLASLLAGDSVCEYQGHAAEYPCGSRSWRGFRTDTWDIYEGRDPRRR
jgi:hypothetical protein